MIGKKALIMVDLQNDFCSGGALAVPFADEIVPLANQLQNYFDIVVATQDWHPEDHTSFAFNHPTHQVGDVIMIDDLAQVLWPVHCVQNSDGAAFHPQLRLDKISKIFQKGTDKYIDSYSAFFDNAHRRSTGLYDYLRAENIVDVYILGLATDYCVKYSSLDAANLKFNVYVITDACRGVELQVGDSAKALQEMNDQGIRLITSQMILPIEKAKKIA